jgi:antitoxin ParD1/3/4
MATKTMNISLTGYWQTYVEAHLRKGRYQNASELMREALRLHEREEIARDLAEVDRLFGAKDKPESPADIKRILRTVATVRKELKGRHGGNPGGNGHQRVGGGGLGGAGTEVSAAESEFIAARAGGLGFGALRGFEPAGGGRSVRPGHRGGGEPTGGQVAPSSGGGSTLAHGGV